jgi:hypothetical protein
VFNFFIKVMNGSDDSLAVMPPLASGYFGGASITTQEQFQEYFPVTTNFALGMDNELKTGSTCSVQYDVNCSTNNECVTSLPSWADNYVLTEANIPNHTHKFQTRITGYENFKLFGGGIDNKRPSNVAEQTVTTTITIIDTDGGQSFNPPSEVGYQVPIGNQISIKYIYDKKSNGITKLPIGSIYIVPLPIGTEQTPPEFLLNGEFVLLNGQTLTRIAYPFIFEKYIRDVSINSITIPNMTGLGTLPIGFDISSNLFSQVGTLVGGNSLYTLLNQKLITINHTHAINVPVNLNMSEFTQGGSVSYPRIDGPGTWETTGDPFTFKNLPFSVLRSPCNVYAFYMFTGGKVA